MTGAALDALKDVHHPSWNPAHDLAILKGCAVGISIDRIAIGLIRDRKAVEQRWHMLRVVPGIYDRLAATGPSAKPYPSVVGQ